MQVKLLTKKIPPCPPDLVEKHAHKQSPQRIEELTKIFIHATRV